MTDTSLKVFIPIRVLRCRPSGGGKNSSRLGELGYYGGRKVIRWKCNSPGCKRRRGEDGTEERIVTFHHDDVETGERVLPDERLPYRPPEER